MALEVEVKKQVYETPRTGFNWLIPIYVVAIAFVVLFLVVPLGKVILETLGLIAGSESLPVDLLQYMMRITWNSVRLALLTTFVSLAVAIPVAIAVNKLRVPLGMGWTVLLTVPLITPPFISSFATILLLGRTGILTRFLNMLGVPSFSIYGLPGLVITQVLHLMPYSLLVIVAGLQSVPAHLEEAAHSLGESFWGTMGKVVLPYILPHILMGGTLVFLTSLGDIGAPLLVGGNYRVLPVEIYSNFVSFLGDDRIPVVFSAWIILMACLMMLVVNRLLKRTELKHSFRTRAITYDLPGLRRAATVFLALVTILFLLPYATIVVSSFGTVWTTKWLPNAFTLDNYKTAFTDSVAIRNSLILMAGAMPFTLFLSITFGQMNRDVPYMRWFDFITMLPFIIPGVVIGLSITRAWGAVKIGGFDLGGTVLVLLIAISIRRMPHAIRVLSAGFARIDKSLEEASWSLGASRSKTFKDVILPQLKPTIVASGVILSIKLITELGASLILYPPGWRTIPIYIYYYVSEGQIARGSAMGILLIVIIAVGNGIANRLTKDRGGI